MMSKWPWWIVLVALLFSQQAWRTEPAMMGERCPDGAMSSVTVPSDEPDGVDLPIGSAACLNRCAVYAEADGEGARLGWTARGVTYPLLERRKGQLRVSYGESAGWVDADACEVEYLPSLKLDDGFTYDTLTDEVKRRIDGLSYKDDCTVSYDQLRYLAVKYVDFDGVERRGEMICNVAVGKELLIIFRELYRAGYAFTKIDLVDEYGADDRASMRANNTSCFNFRNIAGTDRLSKHALGLAVDVNPLINPYVKAHSFSPANAGRYLDRTQRLKGMIDENDLCYALFTRFGWTWGGSWRNEKDYQHFEKDL